ncbi:MAG: NADP-dependent malic enzyme, partial [Planctomycetes bacterium]|nr:NADP-dependent malic enzyme [Planctomycetota bacterium]
DVFLGLSQGGVVSQEMVRSMARDPIVFALANPDPEISYSDAVAARDDAIVGTGRSDFPNQINNVLGFPFIFRGALDVRATGINESMKLAAVEALARLAKADVPDHVSEAYGNEKFRFGRQYLIPKPLDPRALVEVSSAVARAAMESGVARVGLELEEYRAKLENLLGRTSRIVVSSVQAVRRGRQCRIVFPEGDHEIILQACQRIVSEGVGVPLLVGQRDRVLAAIEKAGLRWGTDQFEILDPATDPRRPEIANLIYRLRKYKGVRREVAEELSRDPVYFSMALVQTDEAECCLSGITRPYAQSLRPALEIIRVQDWLQRCSGLYILSIEDRVYFFADTTVNIDPTPEQLAEIAICAAEAAERFGSTPRVAMLSYSSAGNSKHPRAEKIREAVRVARARYPDLDVVGEIQADAAVDLVLRRERAPHLTGERHSNVLIFPDLDSANIAYKLMLSLGGAEGIGPIVLGLRKPVNVIPRGSTAENVFAMAAVTALEAQPIP